MRANRCCERPAGKASLAVNSGNPFIRRCRDIAGCMLPVSALMLLPKCPVCLAAYIAIVTGVGISVSTATYLRVLFLTLCIASITCLAAKRGRHLYALIFIERGQRRQLNTRGPARRQTS